MASELRIDLPRPSASADARRALKIIEGLIDLLDVLDRADPEHGRNRIKWRFSDLTIGSLHTGLVLERPRPGQRREQAEALFPRLVKGLGYAEQNIGIPSDWEIDAAQKAKRVAEEFYEEQVNLQVRGDLETKQYVITRKSARNLEAALDATMTTLGSLTGRIESVNFHEKLEARLWLEIPRRSILVNFNESQASEIQEALRKRVQLAGHIKRDRGRRAYAIKMVSLRVMPEPSRSLDDFAGIFPDFTGDMTPSEYLEELRESS